MAWLISVVENIWHYLTTIFFWVGFLVGLIFTLQKIVEAIPTLKNAWVNLLKWWATRTQYKENKKYAIKADIENVINSVTTEIKKELPEEWVKKASVRWVNKLEDIQLEDGEVIIRMMPLEVQDDNLIRATHSFFRSLIFRVNSKKSLLFLIYTGSVKS